MINNCVLDVYKNGFMTRSESKTYVKDTDKGVLAARRDIILQHGEFDCIRFAAVYFYSSLMQQKSSGHTSCKTTLFERNLQNIPRLCDLFPSRSDEKAWTLNSRQTAIYAEDTEVTILCREHSGPQTRYNFMVQGLKVISLPQYKDCTASSKIHKWQCFPALDEQYESRSIPITLTATELFNSSDLVIISSLVPNEDTKLASINARFSGSLAEIRRANTIHTEGRTTSWHTWIAVLAIIALLFLSVLATIWLIRKHDQTNGKPTHSATNKKKKQWNYADCSMHLSPTLPSTFARNYRIQNNEP